MAVLVSGISLEFSSFLYSGKEMEMGRPSLVVNGSSREAGGHSKGKPANIFTIKFDPILPKSVNIIVCFFFFIVISEALLPETLSCVED